MKRKHKAKARNMLVDVDLHFERTMTFAMLCNKTGCATISFLSCSWSLCLSYSFISLGCWFDKYNNMKYTSLVYNTQLDGWWTPNKYKYILKQNGIIRMCCVSCCMWAQPFAFVSLFFSIRYDIVILAVEEKAG